MHIDRQYSMREEMAALQVNSEYAELKEAILFVPDNEIHELKNPSEALHLAPINKVLLEQQLVAYAKKLQSFGVTVHQMQGNHHSPPNLMYVHDLFFNTPEGAIVARMATEVRASEEFFIGLELARHTVPTRLSVTGTGVFEGSDALWLNSKNVLISVGHRSNDEAFEQISWSLKLMGVKTHKIKLPKGLLHLHSLLKMVDKDLALVRTELAPKPLLTLLKKLKIKVAAVPESDEVTVRQGFNIVVINPRQVVMPSFCTELKKIYTKHKIKVLAEMDISELIKGGGGLACATGILSRTAVK